MTAPWDKSQADLLLWLSKEDTSLRGECDGPSLDAVVDAGFAHIISGPLDKDYDRVALTEAGWARVAELKRGAP